MEIEYGREFGSWLKNLKEAAGKDEESSLRFTLAFSGASGRDSDRPMETRAGDLMSEQDFKNRTQEIDDLLADPDVAVAVKKHRVSFEQADREYAMGLAEVRQAFGLTQVELAQKLGTVQANVSKTENRHDLLLSTLANYFAAMGADDVKIVLRRGDREIEIAFDALTPQG